MKYILAIFGVILLLLLLAVAAYLSFFTIASSETETVDEEDIGQEITITGTVFENIIQVPADGNNFLMVDVEIGRIQVLYEQGGRFVTGAAADQCNDNEIVAQTAQSIQPGDEVEIFGIRREGAFYLDVCSSTDYYINVIGATAVLDIPAVDNGGDDMQETRQVTGEVVELISDCAFDGNCAYVVETESGEQVTVIWAEGMSPICQNDPFQGGDTDIQVGDSIDSFGRVIDEITISGCGDPSYYIRKTS